MAEDAGTVEVCLMVDGDCFGNFSVLLEIDTSDGTATGHLTFLYTKSKDVNFHVLVPCTICSAIMHAHVCLITYLSEQLIIMNSL